MADSKDTKQKKRKVEDEGEEVAAAKTKRAKAEKPVKIKAAPKFKPYSPAEEVIAAGASMQRNAAIADFVKGIMERNREEKEYIKAASAKKAYDSLVGLTTPILLARDLIVLNGIGKGTVDKIEAFLEENPTAGGAAGGAFNTGSAPVKGSAEDFSWLAEYPDRDVVIGMLEAGTVTFDVVKGLRDDIKEGDF